MPCTLPQDRALCYLSPRITNRIGDHRQLVPTGAGGEASHLLQAATDTPLQEESGTISPPVTAILLPGSSHSPAAPGYPPCVFSGESPPSTGTQQGGTSQEIWAPYGRACRGAECLQFPAACSVEQSTSLQNPAYPGCPRPDSGEQIPELPWGQDMMSSWGKRGTPGALHTLTDLLHVWQADASLVCAWEPGHRAHVAPTHLPPSFPPFPLQGPPKVKHLALSSRLGQSEVLFCV